MLKTQQKFLQRKKSNYKALVDTVNSTQDIVEKVVNCKLPETKEFVENKMMR